jgi:hypothetical protein
MLSDGQGMIIGGLIDERDSTTQQKIPYLGNTKAIGWLFRKTTVTKKRTEIVFALLPRIQPYEPGYQAYEQGELVKSGVPLFHGPLQRTNRPWDPILPDGKRVTVPLNPRKALEQERNLPRWPAHSAGYVVPDQLLPELNSIDPSFPPDQAFGPTMAGPFLSDESGPAPGVPYQPTPSVEIFSDQPR